MQNTILIVDDSRIDRTILNGFLSPTYTVIEAASVKEMVSILETKSNQIAAILLDLVMPEYDGFEGLRIIQKNQDFSQIPVIVVSSKNDEETQQKALSLGAANFTFKPYNQFILLHLLENIISLREKSAIYNTFYLDALTGLLNKTAFLRQAEELIQLHEPGYYVLSCFDIDKFKIINEQYGIDVGNNILKKIADRLSMAITPINGLCCRDNADKFILLYPTVYVDSSHINQLHEALKAEKLEDQSLRVCVGRYYVNDTNLDVSIMYDRATIAEESIKGRYDEYIAEYTDSMRQDLLYEQAIVNDMIKALDENEFIPWFQPQYNHATGALIGAEALVRWFKNGKIVTPNDFIPIFERNGFIYEVDKNIWEKTCILLRRWLDEGSDPLPVSVNISRYDLVQNDFLDTICSIVNKYSIPIDLIRLEVTESAFMDSTNVIYTVVNQLIKKGFTVEIDDFGSGFSSLNTLKDIPASILKLDMRFFEKTGDSKRGGNIVESVVRMAKWLGMAVIAEGVEDLAQADYLKSIGCYYIQGYLYAKPMPTQEYEKLLVSRNKEANLTQLKTVKNLDNNNFWDAHSMDTLIFNSYVGAACIVEFTDKKIEMIRATDYYVKILGSNSLTIKDVLAIDWTKHIDKANLKRLRDAVKKSIKILDSVTIECEFRNLPGCSEILILRCTLRAIAKTGERCLVYCLNENTTAQRVAEREASIVSERINAVMDNSHTGIFAGVPYPNGQYKEIFVNNRFYEIHGYTKEQFDTELENPFDCLYSEDREKVFNIVTKLNKVGDSSYLQYRFIRRDGSIGWMRSDISVVKFANIDETAQLNSFLDITEQKENEIKSLENARQLEVIMSNVNGGVSAIQFFDNMTSKFVFNNDKYYELYGYTRQEAVSSNLDILTLIVPEDLPMVMAKINQLKADHQPRIIDYRITKKDGSYALLRANASLMSVPGYSDDVITSVVTDITEVKSLEETLSAVISNIYGGISAVYLNDDKLEIVLSNDQYYKLIGYTREEFESKKMNPFDVIHPDDREWVLRKFKESEKYGEQYSMEYRIVRPDGEIRYILCNTNVFHLFGIDLPVQLAVSNDITELRETQRKELAASVQLQTIVKNIYGGITAAVPDGKDHYKLIFANQGFYEIHGYTKEQMEVEVINHNDLIYPEDLDKVLNTIDRVINERISETYEYRCYKRDGSTVWIQCTNSVYSLDGVGDTIVLGIYSDVTELRNAQHERLVIADRLNAVMNAMSNGMIAFICHDDKFDFMIANKRFYEMQGAKSEVIKDNSLDGILNLVSKKDKDSVKNAFYEVAKSGQPTVIEYQIKRLDNKVRWIKAIISMTKVTGVDYPVQMTIFSDITKERESSEQLSFLNEASSQILAQPNSEIAINNTLELLLNYFEGERVQIFEFDSKKPIINSTYELCAPGVEAEIENWQGIILDERFAIFDKFKNDGFVVITDIREIYDESGFIYELLLAQKTNSLIIAPLWREKVLIGFICIDNPSKAINQTNQLTALTDYMAVLLTRRDLIRAIEHGRSITQQLMDDTPGGFLRVRIELGSKPVIENFNNGFCEMLGVTSQELVRKYKYNVQGYLVEDDLPIVEKAHSDALNGNQLYDCRCRIIRKDGSYLWVHVYGRYLKDEKGNLVRNSYFTDITDKILAEENQKVLLDNLPFGAAMYEFDGTKLKVIHINRQYWKLVDREPVDYSKTSVTDAVYPDDRDIVLQELKAAIRQNRSISVDLRVLGANGKYLPFHINANIIRKSENDYQVFAAYSLITDEAISLQEMLPIAVRIIMESSDDITYIKGSDLRYISCSKALANLAGYDDTRDIIGKSAYDIFDKKFATKYNEDDMKILETGVPVVNSIDHIPNKDGSIGLARTSKYPIQDGAGNVIGVYCISHDISAQSQRDSQLELLTNSIPGGLASFLITKKGFKVLYFNDGFYDFSGYTREEYIALTDNDPLALVFEEDKNKVRKVLQKITNKRIDGMIGTCDFRCHTKNGQTRFLSLKMALTKIDDNQHIINVVQFDMTSHVEVEQRMKNLLDNLPFGTAMYELDGEELTPIHANQQYLNMIGRDIYDTQYDEYSTLDFIHPDDREIVSNSIKEAILNKTEAISNVRIIQSKNKYVSFHIESKIVEQPDGKYIIYSAFTRISDDKMTYENALPYIFSKIMESNTDLAYAKDINFRYICCSKSFATLLGLKNEKEVIGKTDYELFPKKIAEMFRKDDTTIFTTKKSQVDILQKLPLSNEAEHYICTSKYLLRNDVDTVIGIYCIGRDVTKTRKESQQLGLITNNIPGGIATFQYSNGVVEPIYFNDGVCKLAGYTRQEYEASKVPLLSLIIDEDKEIMHNHFEQIKDGEKDFNFIVRIRTKSGEIKWINTISSISETFEEKAIINAVLTDVTQQQLEKRQLHLLEEEYRIATSQSGHTIGRYDIATKTLNISKDVTENLGLPEAITNVPYGRVEQGKISKSTAKEYIDFYEKIMAGEKECSVTFQKLLPIGWRWITARATTIYDETGSPVSAVISYADVTDQQEKEAIYKKWQQNLNQKQPKSYVLYQCNLNKNYSYDTAEGELFDVKAVLDDPKLETFDDRTKIFAKHCVINEDRNMYLQFVNADTMLANYYRGKRSASIDFRGLIATGEVHWIHLFIELVEYPNTKDVAAYMMYEDINESKLQAIKTQALAETDPLTGLFNRKTFIGKIDEAMATRVGKSLYALILFDIDCFKLINDSFGHGVGDQMLIDITRIIRSQLSEDDFASRMGGDEFLICLSAMSDKKTIMARTKKILNAIHEVSNIDIRLSVSAGIAVCPDDGNTFEKLYPKADKALYHVKNHGKDNCAFYDTSMQSLFINTNENTVTPIDKEKKSNILLIDEQETNRKIINNILADDYSVITVDEGYSAFSYLRHNAKDIALIILNLNLSDMDSFTVIERLKQEEDFANIPIVIICENEERDNALRLIKAGANDYIMKPIDPTLLRIRVESSIARAENDYLHTQNRILKLLAKQDNR